MTHTDQTPERPLATFALFAYNQEKYIREAVEGAFAQTYEPLEIILSDDCSGDRTLEIMEEMARDYSGPHKVSVRQTERNKGPYSHVLSVAEISNGSVMVLAAGDDISKPDRTECIVASSLKSDAWAFHSRYDIIDETGNIVEKSTRTEGLFSKDSEFCKYFHDDDGEVFVVHGGTSAYRKNFLDQAPQSEEGILSEDGVFSILLNMMGGRALFLEESLVSYRQHAGAISHTSTSGSPNSIQSRRASIQKEMRYAKNIADRAELALKMSEVGGFTARRLNKPYMNDEVVIHSAKYKWRSVNTRYKIGALSVAGRRGRFGYLIPAVLGDKAGSVLLYWVKRLRSTRSEQ